jgi:hypothetical protein
MSDKNSDMDEYETVERVTGVYKYRNLEGHKSNLYSIRIYNSNLGSDSPQMDRVREALNSSIRDALSHISPMHTELLKIEYIDE